MTVPDPSDAAVPDAAVPDAAVPDAAVPDAAVPDAAVPDDTAPESAGADPAAPESPAEPTAAKVSRRRQGIAALLLALAAIGLWGASRMEWALVLAYDGISSDVLTPDHFEVLGSDWSPWLTPVAIVLIAAIAVLFSVRGWVLRALAVLIALTGVVTAIPAISLIREGENNLYAAEVADMNDSYTVFAVEARTLPGAVVLIAAVCTVLAGVVLLRSSGRAAGMSSKYTSPAARREELERRVFEEHERRLAAGEAVDDESGPVANERELWDALDNGVDPTEK